MSKGVKGRFWVAALGLTTGLLAFGPPEMARASPNCSPNLPEECSEAVTCGATMDDFNDPHFQVEFLSRSYDAIADETTFVYLICQLQTAPNLSHWVLGLCEDLRLGIIDFHGGDSSSGPVAPDPTTCLDGLKFGTPGGVPLCDDTCPAGSNTGGIFSVTFSGDVPTAIVPAGVTIATKAGQVTDDLCLEGPACAAGTTTTSTSTSTSTTTSSTSTSTSTSSTSSSTTSTSTSSSTTTTDPGASTTTTLDPTTSSTSSTSTSSTSTSTSSSTSSTATSTTSTSSTTTSTTLECVADADCNDGDNCTDDICNQGVCEFPPSLPSGPETICNDMVDNDCDGSLDCDDPDCSGIDPCPPIHRDPSKIIFAGREGMPDKFTSHGRVEPGEPLDVGSLEVGWMISKPTGPVWRGALIPGDFRSNLQATTFRFVDRDAKEGRGKRFGIYKAKIRISRGGTAYGYKLLAYGDFSRADTPDMTIQFYIGDRIFVHDKPWTETSWGWKADSFE